MGEGREPGSLFEFGPFVMDGGRRRLLRGGETVPLTRKEFATLLVLVRGGGRVVEKRELMEAVWPDAHVEEGNLAVHVSKLRAKLGRRADGGPYIETEAGHGYRFTASVRELEEVDLVFRKRTRARFVTEEVEETEEPAAVAPARRGRTLRPTLALIAAAVVVAGLAVAASLSYSGRRGAEPKAAAAGTRTLAVFPFALINADAADEYLGLAMADALTTRLSNVRQVVVRPTSAVRKVAGSGVAEGGRRLGVEAVLEGSIQKAGDRLRVTAQLVRTADEVSLWAGTFEAPLTDVFAVQDAISEQLAAALARDLTAGERASLTRRDTSDPEAYRLYVLGRSYWSQRDYDGMVAAASFFRQAAERDPNFALAYVGLADTLVMGMAQSYDEARRAQEKALTLAPDLGEAYASRGFGYMFHRWDWDAAERDLRRAIELNPGYGTAHQWLATLLAIRGHTEEAKAAMQRALEIDPQSPNFLADMGQLHYFAREYAEAEAYCRRALEVAPDFAFAHQYLGFIYAKTGRDDEALEEMLLTGQLMSRMANYPDAASAAQQRLHYRESLRGAGLKGFAREEVKRLRMSPPTDGSANYALALRFALLGDREEMLRGLERAVAARAFMAAFAYAEPLFDDLRAEPRYQRLMRDANLTP